MASIVAFVEHADMPMAHWDGHDWLYYSLEQWAKRLSTKKNPVSKVQVKRFIAGLRDGGWVATGKHYTPYSNGPILHIRPTDKFYAELEVWRSLGRKEYLRLRYRCAQAVPEEPSRCAQDLAMEPPSCTQAVSKPS